MAANDDILSIEVVDDHMKRMPERVSETYRTRLGKFHGLEAGIILHPLERTEVGLDGDVRCREQLMQDNPGPRAVPNALKRLANGYEADGHHLEANIVFKDGQLRDYEGRIGKPFVH